VEPASPAEPLNWRVVALDESGLPSASQRSLPDPRTARCELCERTPTMPLDAVLVIDGPVGLPVPFLVCDDCRQALVALHALLTSAAR
jgi:hypothetical protein